MTKEEKIIEAWGGTNENINENGWYYFGYCVNGWDDVKEWLEENDLISDESYYDMTCRELDNGDLILVQVRPKSLQGIENNNGWIEIESEADLPKLTIDYYVLKNGSLTTAYYRGNNRWFIPENDYPKTTEIHKITHYQPIEKPKPPLY